MNVCSKKCKIKPWKCPDKVKQQETIDKINHIQEECKEGKSIILFEDAVHQLHTTSTWYALQFRWNKNTKVFESNTWRKRLTVLWCIDPNNIEFTAVQTDLTCNIDLMKSLLDKLQNKYKEWLSIGKTIYMVLDNARYQKSYKVQDYAKELWIELVYLAPYCPHLNLIERLWKWFKKKLKNRYFATFEEFRFHIQYVIWSISNSYLELKSLLTFNFPII